MIFFPYLQLAEILECKVYEHLLKLSSPAQYLARLFPNEDLAGDNPLGQCQREQQNSFTAALDLPSAPGAQGWCARLG